MPAGDKSMISFEEALNITLGAAPELEAVALPLEDAAGFHLAEDVAADSDLPPFDKSAMDGYAVRASDVPGPGEELKVEFEVSAGDEPGRGLSTGLCARIFTGAPVPEGADTVVIQEETGPGGSHRTVRFLAGARAGKNICRRGEDVRSGEVVISSGSLVRAAEVSLAAAAGRGRLRVWRRPLVTILSTGNELLAPGSAASGGRIRDSNGPALAARLRAARFEARYLGIARDDPRELRSSVEEGLSADVLVVSGGVSVGDRDLVPEVLKALGAELLFDSVAVKPGKPTKLARLGRRLVFGLPGNPFSALVIAEMLVLPALRKMSGDPEPVPPPVRGVLASDVRKKPGRRAFLPARLAAADPGFQVHPVPSHGAADVASYARADCLLTLPADSGGAPAGSVVEVFRTDARPGAAGDGPGERTE